MPKRFDALFNVMSSCLAVSVGFIDLKDIGSYLGSVIFRLGLLKSIFHRVCS